MREEDAPETPDLLLAVKSAPAQREQSKLFQQLMRAVRRWMPRRRSRLLRGFSPAALEEALLLEGCPVCRLVDCDLPRQYFWYLHEYYGESEWVHIVTESGGFCNRHAWDLARTRAEYPLGVVYQYLIRGVYRRLKQLHQAAQGADHARLNKLKRTLGPRTPCPMCAYIETDAAWKINDLLVALRKPEIQERYRKSTGLCILHLRQAIDLAEGSTLLTLLESEFERLGALDAELSEYFRKVDYRFKDEPKGSEQTAWLRAIEHFVGKER